MLFLTLIWMQHLVKCQDDAFYDCSDALDCVNTSMIGAVDIDCSGYKSCFKAAMEVEGGSIDCSGSYSCFNAAQIVQIDENDYGFIDCRGLMSCAEVSNLSNFYGNIFCHGELSCFKSIIYSKYNTVCEGDRSCAESIITDSYQVDGKGAYSLYNATMYSKHGESYYNFGGSYSGYNAQIICLNGLNCSINVDCYSNGCNNLSIICEDEDLRSNGSCDVIIHCENSEQNDLCPNGHIVENDFHLPNFYDYYDEHEAYKVVGMDNIVIYNYYNNFEKYSVKFCHNYNNSFSVINCDDYVECKGDIMNYDSALCCNGYNSCSYAKNITTWIDFGEYNHNLNGGDYEFKSAVAIRCDGYYGCAGVDFYIHAKNGGNIFLSGEYAAAYSDKIITNDSFSIFCNGVSACNSVQLITKCNNLYCNGEYSCSWTYINDIRSAIYGNGVESLSLATISNLETGTVYCAAKQSCHGSTISDVENIFAYSYRALYDSKIYNVTNVLYANGYKAMRLSAIINHINNKDISTKIYCRGTLSCAETMIVGLKYFYSNGTNGLSGAMIITGGLKSETKYTGSDDNSNNKNNNNSNYNVEKTIVIDSENSEQFYIYCSPNDICNINCNNENSCRMLYLYCFGQCFISCPFSDSMGSPNSENYNYSESSNCNLKYGVYTQLNISLLNPTKSSTHLISNIPTAVPSRAPNSDSSDSQNVVLLALVVAGTVVAIVVIIIIFLCCKNSKSTMMGNSKNNSNNGNTNTEIETECENLTELSAYTTTQKHIVTVHHDYESDAKAAELQFLSGQAQRESSGAGNLSNRSKAAAQ